MPKKSITICPRCHQPVDPRDPLSITSKGDGNHTGNTYHSNCPPVSTVKAIDNMNLFKDTRKVERIRKNERIRTPAMVQDLRKPGKPSWRVYCKTCREDISEPTDRRTAKKFMNEHIKNQGHDAILIQEGLLF